MATNRKVNKHAQIGYWILLIFILFYVFADINRDSVCRPRHPMLLIPIVYSVQASEPTMDGMRVYSSSKEEMESFVKEVFKKDDEKALKVLSCENHSWKIDAINWNHDGTQDWGLFQINTVHGFSKTYLFDWKNNVLTAYKIYKDAGYKFTPWTCAWVVNQRPFYK